MLINDVDGIMYNRPYDGITCAVREIAYKALLTLPTSVCPPCVTMICRLQVLGHFKSQVE